MREARLPGLSAWKRVADYRLGQIQGSTAVTLYRDSALTADDILGFGFAHVAVATGSSWRHDGVGRRLLRPAPLETADVLSPDELMAGLRPKHRNVVIYDDDHYYMGGVLAELLATEGFTVAVVTPAAEVSTWMRMTMEQLFVQHRLVNMGVKIISHHSLVAATGARVTYACGFTGKETVVDDCSLVPVTARLPHAALGRELLTRRGEWEAAGIRSVALIGDALAPGTIAAAVWAGRRYAEDFDEERGPVAADMRREVTGLAPGPFYWERDKAAG
jgi:dimethylamine/trimethylamine dehydrogenase